MPSFHVTNDFPVLFFDLSNCLKWLNLLTLCENYIRFILYSFLVDSRWTTKIKRWLTDGSDQESDYVLVWIRECPRSETFSVPRGMEMRGAALGKAREAFNIVYRSSMGWSKAITHCPRDISCISFFVPFNSIERFRAKEISSINAIFLLLRFI